MDGSRRMEGAGVQGEGPEPPTVELAADDPALRFDPAWFRATYPGSADRARRPGGPPILQVYLTQARALGVSPNRHFDERYYRAIHRDVDRAVEAGGFWSGFHHYVRHGHAERRRARPAARRVALDLRAFRSEEHTSELQSLMRISYAVFFLKKK